MRVVNTNAGKEPLTPQQIAEIEAAKDYPIVSDDECPVYSYEELLSFKEAAARRGRRNRHNARD